MARAEMCTCVCPKCESFFYCLLWPGVLARVKVELDEILSWT